MLRKLLNAKVTGELTLTFPSLMKVDITSLTLLRLTPVYMATSSRDIAVLNLNRMIIHWICSGICSSIVAERGTWLTFNTRMLRHDDETSSFTIRSLLSPPPQRRRYGSRSPPRDYRESTSVQTSAAEFSSTWVLFTILSPFVSLPWRAEANLLHLERDLIVAIGLHHTHARLHTPMNRVIHRLPNPTF